MRGFVIPVIVSILILGISIPEDAFTHTTNPIITETQIVFPGGEFIDDFGFSVSIDGNTAVVGTIFDFIQDPPGTFFDTGAAYIYERNSGGNWIEVQVIRPSGNPDDAQFGNSVAISGDTIVVGAHFEGNFQPGAAYIFEKTSGVWPPTETRRILALDIEVGDNFGTSVDISGDTVIVGSFTDKVFDFGAVYIFEKTGGVWPATETKKISASDDANSDSFGESVSIDGNTIIVGSPSDDAGVLRGLGAAYIFEKGAGGWPATETKIIIASDRAEFDNFGSSVSISGDTVIVGADFEDVNGSASGSAYIFEKNAGVWPTTETKKIFASDGTNGDNFGTSVSISGDIAIAGSPTADVISGFQEGVVYAFEKNAGIWPMTESHKLQGSTDTEGDDFGTSVSISGGNVIVGLPDDDILITDNDGSAYFFELELIAQADLSLVKTFEPETISAGDTFTYFLTVKNNGPSEAENVVVEDELPSVAPLDTTFIGVTPVSPVCTFSAGKITCNLGNMALNEEKVIAISVKTHDEATQGGFILNDATVKSDTEDPNPLNDKGSALIEIEIEGDLKLFAPDGSVILESKEEFPGGMVVVNDDNDNMDGSFDLNDVGNTNNEDELVKLEIAKLTAPKGELYLNGDFGTDKVSVYKNSDRTNKITSFPVEVSESDVFFVEGLKSSILTEVNFELTPLNQPLESLDLVRLTVIKIESITFQGQVNSATDTDTLDNNSHPNDANGLRVFPGARLDPAAGMPGMARDKVTVVVTLSNQVPVDSGIDIFLKSFDVDDPTSNIIPLDDETLIADNRGFANIGPSSSLEGVLDGQDVNGISKLTFAKGEDKKTIDFAVSMQPGDNYKIAAHFDEDFVKSLRNDDTKNDGDKIFDDKSNKPLTNNNSEVLTVWRFLHLELDTMMGPALATPIAVDDDRFILPRTPDISIVNSYLDDSYIVSKILGGSIDTSDNALFDYHTTDAEASSTLPFHPCFEKRDFDKNRDEFWFIYLLSVFQGGPAADYDPDGSKWELGYNPPNAGVDNNCIVIYQENIRDVAANSNIVVASGIFRFDLEQATVIHEIGHPLINQYSKGGDDHLTGLIMNNNWPEDFVDTNGNGIFDAGEPVNPIPTRFSDTALNSIRSEDRPGS